MTSHSAQELESDGDPDDSIVEMIPSPRKVVEIDLTDSPMGPKVRTKLIGNERAPNSTNVAANAAPPLATATASTNTSPMEKADGCFICLDSHKDIRYNMIFQLDRKL